MAQGIRSRSLVALLAAFAACGGNRSGPPVGPAAGAVPRQVDTAKIADAELVAAILDECHRPLRGRMDRVAAELRCGDGSVLRVFAQLPETMRVVTSDGLFLVRGEQFFRLDGPKREDGSKDTTVPTAVRERLEAVRGLVDAASFGPLHRAVACAQLGAGEYRILPPEGTPWLVQLRGGTLLPEVFRRGDFEVVVRDYLATKTTWIARRVEQATLGVCEITFELADLAWDADFFAAPTSEIKDEANAKTGAPATAKTAGDVIPYIAQGRAEPRSPTPILIDAPAVDWVVLQDPGTWPRRAEVYKPVHDELDRQNQAIPGFPILLRDGDQDLLAIPFRARDAKQPLQAPAQWQLRKIPASRLLVCYPPAGDFAARCALGEKLLREAAAAQSLRLRGPIVCQPFFHLDEGEPPAAKLQAPVVRVSVPVE